MLKTWLKKWPLKWPQQWLDEFLGSVKSFDVEERLDLFAYRPLGFLIAKAAWRFDLWPVHLSIAGAVLGVAAAVLFGFSPAPTAVVWGAILFFLSGVLDSSDGQLARMAKRSTPFGLVLDGVCDNIVFAAVYIGSCLSVLQQGYWTSAPALFFLAIVAGIFHSMQASILDFYNREYLYFGCGRTEGDYWNPDLEEARAEAAKGSSLRERLFARLRFSWLAQQQMLTTRTVAWRQDLRGFVLGNSGPEKRDQVMRAYRDHNRTMLRLWQLLGSNAHTILIIVFNAFGRFDLYLILVDCLALNAILVLARFLQARQDQRLAATI